MTRLNDPMNRMPSMERPQQSQYRSNNAMSFGGSRPGSQSGMGNQNPLQGLLTFKPSGNPMSPLRPQSPYDEYYMPKRDMADARSAISNYMSGGNQSRSSNAQPSPSAYGSGRQQQMPFLPGRGSSSTTQPQYDDLLYRFNPDAPAMSKREMVYLGGAFNKPLGGGSNNISDFAVPVAGGFQRGSVFDSKNDASRTMPRQFMRSTDGYFNSYNGFLSRQAARRTGSPVGSEENNQWVAAINEMPNAQLDDFFAKNTIPYYKKAFSPNSDRITSAPLSTDSATSGRAFAPDYGEAPAPPPSTEPYVDKTGDDPWVQNINSTDNESLDYDVRQGLNLFMNGDGYDKIYPYYGNIKLYSPPDYSMIDGFARRHRYGVTRPEKTIPPSSATPAVPGAGAPLPAAPQSPLLQQMFGASAPQGNMSSLSNPMRQQTPEDALADFNAEARRLAAQPRESMGKIISDRIAENIEDASRLGRIDAENTVANNLYDKRGYYATPSQRRSGFFNSGMGALPSDAAIMESQNRPLSDGGPAAAAARADQEERRKRAEDAMGGPSPDGLIRYMPEPDLLAFANQDRRREDQQKFSALQDAGMFPNPQSGSNPNIGTFQREDLKAMTPSEIQFYRHKMNMATNPVYRDRINAKRQARSQDLANQTKTRLEMAANRRQAAADAAGASQQLRNLVAGRGAIGGGQDGFNALMSLAAMQDPNQAFGNYGPSYMAQTAPERERQYVEGQKDIMKSRADIDKIKQNEAIRQQILVSDVPDIEKQRRLQTFDNYIMGSGVGNSGGFGSDQVAIPSWVPSPDRIENDTRPTAERIAAYREKLKNNSQFSRLPAEQQELIASQMIDSYFGQGATPSDIADYEQDNNPYWWWRNVIYPFQELFGVDRASDLRRREKSRAMTPFSGSPPTQGSTGSNQAPVTPKVQTPVSPPSTGVNRYR
jgi:hypothetical protein